MFCASALSIECYWQKFSIAWKFINCSCINHDDVIKWKHFPRNWPFARGIHRSSVNSPHKDQWRGALIFFFDLHLNIRLSKQSWGWWFETLSRPLWRHCNVKCHGPLFLLCFTALGTILLHRSPLISLHCGNGLYIGWFNCDGLAQGKAYKLMKEPINYRGPNGDRTHYLQPEGTPPAASCPARPLHATAIV